MRCEHLHDSAVYVLGALSPPEREAYERHLATCAECRAEVTEFADLPGLLGRLDPELAQAIAAEPDAGDGEPSPAKWAGPTFDASSAGSSAASEPSAEASGPSWAGPTAPAAWAGPTAPAAGTDAGVNGSGIDPLLPRVLDRAQRARRTERRRRRWQTVGTALVAACLGVLAVFGVRAAGIGQPATPDFTAMQEVAAKVPITADLALESFSGGTKVHMRCEYKSGIPNGKWTYKLVVVQKSGSTEELDTWTAGTGDEYELTARSNIPREDIQRVEIRKGDGTPLLVFNA